MAPRIPLLALVAFGAMALSCNPSADVADGGTPNTCPAVTGAGTTHAGNVSADETWTAAGSPHLVTSSIRVDTGATLTIEPCAEVRIAASDHIEVDGNLVAEGAADKPITFGKSDAEPWGYIAVFAPGMVSLAYATIDGGGGDTVNSYGAIEARGDQTLPAQPVLKVRSVAVTGSAAFGVSLRAGGAFTADSSDLQIHGSQTAPMRINPRLATNVPTGDYTGNALDAIVVETEAYGDVSLEDVTFHDRGVPYQIGGDKTFGTFVVGGGSNLVALTLEPGVVLRFIKNGGAVLHVDKGSGTSAATGVLVAKGTASQPIVFTSAADPPAPGDWVGIDFNQMPSASNRLDHVEVRYAGGPSLANGFHCEPDGSYSKSEDAAISIYGQPAAGMITSSTVSDSAGAGINLAYQGTPVDFMSGNTFSNVASCKVTTPRDVTGSCPATSPCP